MRTLDGPYQAVEFAQRARPAAAAASSTAGRARHRKLGDLPPALNAPDPLMITVCVSGSLWVSDNTDCRENGAGRRVASAQISSRTWWRRRSADRDQRYGRYRSCHRRQRRGISLVDGEGLLEALRRGRVRRRTQARPTSWADRRPSASHGSWQPERRAI
ncbi:hypothetical protein HBB16_01475 [Pseudonocardia sp. MCCB 268]|nr:hypothetical protein [Pseudonocardia cytotoxica]